MLLDSMSAEEYSYTTSDTHTAAKLVIGAIAGMVAGKLSQKAYDKAYWTVQARRAAKVVEVVTD
jgi:hypothetical protein